MITSALRINLQPSSLYCRLMMVLYLLTGMALYTSAMPWWMKGAFAFLLIGQLLTILRQKKPHPELQSLNYREPIWQLNDSKVDEYTELRCLFNLGFCQIYTLKNEAGKKRKLLIFQDQLSKKDQRALNILLFIQST